MRLLGEGRSLRVRSILLIGLVITIPLFVTQGVAVIGTTNPVAALAAVQKDNKSSTAQGSNSSTSGLTYNNTNSGTAPLSKQRMTQLINTIRTLLNQTIDAYKKQNFTHASDLATSAYLDNFEFLEPALLKVDKTLKQNTEFMMRSDLRMDIRQHAPLANVQKLISQINTNLDQAQKLLTK